MNLLKSIKSFLHFLFSTTAGFYINAILGSTLITGLLAFVTQKTVIFIHESVIYLALCAPLFLGIAIGFFLLFFQFRKAYLKSESENEALKDQKKLHLIFDHGMYWNPITKLSSCPQCRAFMKISTMSQVPNFYCQNCEYVPSSTHTNPDHISAYDVQKIMKKKLEEKYPNT